MAQKKSFRLRFVFWLDMFNGEEQALGDYVEELKSQRKFVQTIRDGLRLIRDLRAGNTAVLLELFPLVKGQLVSSPATNDATEIKRELDTLKELLLKNTTLIAPVYLSRSIAPVVDGQKSLSAPKFDLPSFDDDDGDDELDTLVLTKEARDSRQNFMNVMLGYQQ